MSMNPTIQAYKPADRYFIYDMRRMYGIQPPSLVIGTYSPPRSQDVFKVAVPLQLYREDPATGGHHPVTPFGHPEENGRSLMVRV